MDRHTDTQTHGETCRHTYTNITFPLAGVVIIVPLSTQGILLTSHVWYDHTGMDFYLLAG